MASYIGQFSVSQHNDDGAHLLSVTCLHYPEACSYPIYQPRNERPTFLPLGVQEHEPRLPSCESGDFTIFCTHAHSMREREKMLNFF